jgi:hypothetical protein
MMNCDLVTNQGFRQARQLLIPFILFLVTTNIAIATSGDFAFDDSCLDFQSFSQLNEWTKAEVCYPLKSNFPAVNFMMSIFAEWTIISVAAYQRGPHISLVPDWQKDNQWRFLLVGVGNLFDRTFSTNSTWTYDPLINAWTLLPFQEQPTRRYHTLNTWCNTSVILFGGTNALGFDYSNATWLFDGVTETWTKLDVKLWKNGHFVKPRSGHSAVIILQPLSNCTCQESLLVYGGSNNEEICLGDLWEMRCIANSHRREQFYWIPLTKQGDSVWPRLLNQHSSDFNKRRLYLSGGYQCGTSMKTTEVIWEYSLATNEWKNHKLVNIHWFQTCDLADAVSMYYGKLDGIVTFGTACHPYILKPSQNILQFDFMPSDFNWTYRNGPKACAVGGESIFCFAIKHDATTVHKFSYDRKREQWKQVMMPAPRQRSCPEINYGEVSSVGHFAGTSFYIKENLDSNACYVGEQNADTKFGSVLSLWQFDLRIKTWFHASHPFAPLSKYQTIYSVLNNTFLLRYLPSESLSAQTNSFRNIVDVKNLTTAIWLYDTVIQRWTVCLDQWNQTNSRRHQYAQSTMNDLGNGSLLLFGGSLNNNMVNELWRLDLCEQKRYLPMRENCVRWVQLTTNCSSSNYPSPRSSSYALIFRDSLFIFGGKSSGYLSDMWQLNINQLKWKEVHQKGFNPFSLRCNDWTFTKWGTKVTGIPNSAPKRMLEYSYTFDLISFEWIIQAKAPPLHIGALTFRDGKLVALGKMRYTFDRSTYNWNLFAFLIPSCQAGQFSRQWQTESCESCPKGFYAALGSQKCFKCPEGLTTSNRSSSSSADCICRHDYCNNGNCIVAITDKDRSAVCQCPTGYTGSTCKYPTYYLVGIAAIGVMLLVCLVFLLIRFMTKYRRAKNMAEEELTSAHRIWTIRCNEIALKERIDGETLGSYGEVYRGIYRDIVVAVKHLNEVMISDNAVRKEFEREVEIMRGIRHPNVVMFFGAGEIEKEEFGLKICYPFLVIELMERGSLKKILDLPEVTLTYADNVKIALDAARGMQYLHALSPPRIHRDVKSANLLVSHSWVVKVSDFGSARLVRKEGERQSTSMSRVNNDEDCTPLLAADLLMTRDMGTILWRASEIFALQCYGTSADVYSYGIVLWEVLCREDPYKDHGFSWIEDVSKAVQRGTRPTVPPSSPSVYVQLMKECWDADPDRRPRFAEIVDRLAVMANTTSLQGSGGENMSCEYYSS